MTCCLCRYEYAKSQVTAVRVVAATSGAKHAYEVRISLQSSCCIFQPKASPF